MGSIKPNVISCVWNDRCFSPRSAIFLALMFAVANCPDPGALPNGFVTLSSQRDVVTFGCDERYRLVGTTRAECELVGTTLQWNAPVPPTCIPCVC